MSKMYIATAVDTGDTCDGRARVLAAGFDRSAVESEVNLDIANIKEWLVNTNKPFKEGVWTIDTDDGTMGFIWNVEEVEVEIPLSPLQIVELNRIAEDIRAGKGDYFDEDNLTAEEDAYLRKMLDMAGVLVLKDEGLVLTGELREKWLKEHNGKEDA